MISLPDEQAEPACPKQPVSKDSNELNKFKHGNRLFATDTITKKIKDRVKRKEDIIILLTMYLVIGVIDAVIGYGLAFIVRSGEIEVGISLAIIVSPLWPYNFLFDFIAVLNAVSGVPIGKVPLAFIVAGDIIVLGFIALFAVCYFIWISKTRT
ncbi:MAG: hypothetical protein ACXAEU_07300 [Candidatus Hodarchaeales archaeon]|jgi:hypothetical protein